MTLLFSPLTLGKLKLVNRLCVPPMCQYRAKDGVLQAWHRVHYGKLAGSGAGLVVVEATALTPEGRITPDSALALGPQGKPYGSLGRKPLSDASRGRLCD